MKYKMINYTDLIVEYNQKIIDFDAKYHPGDFSLYGNIIQFKSGNSFCNSKYEVIAATKKHPDYTAWDWAWKSETIKPHISREKFILECAKLTPEDFGQERDGHIGIPENIVLLLKAICMRIYNFDYIVTIKAPSDDIEFVFGLKGIFNPLLALEKALANMLTKKIINKD